MKKLGVIVGRFQVSELHKGHLYLFNFVIERSNEVLVLVGTTEAQPSRRNPLNFLLRKEMIKNIFPQVKIFPLADHPSDMAWSHSVDQIILKEFPRHQVSLFGSRESFISFYSGQFPAIIVPEIPAISGSDKRKMLSNNITADRQFLSGIISVQQQRLPISYQTVDIAVVRYPSNEVLLGKKKKDGGKYRFIGGFVDPKDESLESAAMRELHEEAGPIDCHELEYLGSYRISDFRYRSEDDKILTAFFMTYKLSGCERVGDDLDEISWASVEHCEGWVIDEHKPLAKKLRMKISKIKNRMKRRMRNDESENEFNFDN